MNEICQKIRAAYIEMGPDDAKIELTRFAEEISKIHGPDWIAFKTEIKKIIKISDKDLNELKKVTTTTGNSVQKGNWDFDLDLDKEGNIKAGIKNCSIVIDNHPTLKFGIQFNTFLQRICITKDMPWMKDVTINKEGDYVEFDDNKLAQINKWLAHQATQFTKSDIIDSMTDTALENNFNPLSDKLMQCFEGWDGKPRLDTWLFDYLDAKTHEGMNEELEKKYISRVGAMWMISAIARAFHPGSKVDTMLILEGIQGKQKSSFISDLSLGYFLELTTSFVRSKDVVDQLFGKWIVELPELKALSGDSDANKAFLTRQNDKERLSYAKFSKDFPRRCVFIGTTNEDRYLKDITGNRRFWPVKVGKANREKLKQDIIQLWGEAVSRYTDEERWWFDDDEDSELIDMALRIQGIKQDYDETVDQLNAHLNKLKSGKVTSAEIWTDFYGGSMDRFNKNEQMRVAKALRLCGWERSTVRDENKVQIRAWVKPPDTK